MNGEDLKFGDEIAIGGDAYRIKHIVKSDTAMARKMVSEGVVITAGPVVAIDLRLPGWKKLGDKEPPKPPPAPENVYQCGTPTPWAWLIALVVAVFALACGIVLGKVFFP